MRLCSRTNTFTVVVDPLGCRIASVTHNPSGLDFLMHTAWEHEDWTGAFPSPNSSVEWHRRYQGGWHTLVPHSGDAREVDGVEHPFHGEAAWRTWRVIDRSPTSCTFEVVLRTVPLRIIRHVRATENGVEVEQEVENLSADPVNFTWTEHPAFGGALIDPSTTVTLGDELIPIEFPDEGGSHSGFTTALVSAVGSVDVRNVNAGRRATLSWDATLFPYLHIWQEHRATSGFPWWKSANTVAFEPASRPYFDEGPSLGPISVDGLQRLGTSFGLEIDA